MPFQIANGCAVSTHSAPMRIDELGEEISPFVLQDTPAVPNGYRVELEVIDNIPYLRRGSA
eukprot:12590841-Heterocapsa_arctica.AAC.1